MFVSQHQYDVDLLQCAGMAECHSLVFYVESTWFGICDTVGFVTSSMIAASLTSWWSSTFCATWRACSQLGFTSIVVLLAPYSIRPHQLGWLPWLQMLYYDNVSVVCHLRKLMQWRSLEPTMTSMHATIPTYWRDTTKFQNKKICHNQQIRYTSIRSRIEVFLI